MPVLSLRDTLCVEGWRKDYCPEGEDGTQETHGTRVYTYEVREILLRLIREDFLEEGSFLEQLE